MIDLRKKELPSSLVVNGEAFSIDTDFRTWIAWGHEVEANDHAPYFIFTEDVPEDPSWVVEAVSFMSAPNITPRSKTSRGNSARAYDFVEDGEYIVASFQQAYGIDLTDPSLKMHWHRFKALFAGLPGGTKMAEIMGYRSYDSADAKKKPETVRANLREMWRLPRRDEADIISMQYRMFGSLLEGGVGRD